MFMVAGRFRNQMDLDINGFDPGGCFCVFSPSVQPFQTFGGTPCRKALGEEWAQEFVGSPIG